MYGASLTAKRISSYSILLDGSLRLDASLNAAGACLNQTSAFIIPSSHPPFSAYTGSWPGPNGCGMVISTLANGTLVQVKQSWKYVNTSGIHGLAFGPGDKLLYTADLSADKIWTHAVGNDGLVGLVSMYDLPVAGMHPRHLAAHSGGKYLYVLMEHENTVVEYVLDEDSGAPVGVSQTLSLLPRGEFVYLLPR